MLRVDRLDEVHQVTADMLSEHSLDVQVVEEVLPQPIRLKLPAVLECLARGSTHRELALKTKANAGGDAMLPCFGRLSGRNSE